MTSAHSTDAKEGRLGLSENRFLFWWHWLQGMSVLVGLTGLTMVLLPQPMIRFYSLLLYGDWEFLGTLPPQANAYIGFAHGVLGATMLGWACLLLFTLRGPFRKGERFGWQACTVSLLAWFIPDTSLSIAFGFASNAAMNLALLILFAIPLWKTRPLS